MGRRAKNAKNLKSPSGKGRSAEMLSFIVSLVDNYERHHGVRPNLVYMNEMHYGYLREELPGVRDHDDVTAILGVDIALNDETLRPHVASVKFGSDYILSS